MGLKRQALVAAGAAAWLGSGVAHAQDDTYPIPRPDEMAPEVGGVQSGGLGPAGAGSTGSGGFAGLPLTGSQILLLVVVALLLLAAGAATLAWRRRLS